MALDDETRVVLQAFAGGEDGLPSSVHKRIGGDTLADMRAPTPRRSRLGAERFAAAARRRHTRRRPRDDQARRGHGDRRIGGHAGGVLLQYTGDLPASR